MSLESEAVFITAFSNSKTNSTESIQVYDLKTAACIKGYRGLSAGPNSLNILGSNYVVASQKDRSFLQVWQINKNAVVEKKFPVGRKVNVVAICSDYPYYCLLGIDEQIFIYNMSSGREIGMIKRHYQTVSCLKFTACSQFFASAGNDGFVYLWSMASINRNLHSSTESVVQPFYTLGKHCDKVTAIALTDYGRRGRMVSCSSDFTMKIYRLDTGALTHNIATGLALNCVTLNSIGTLAYLGSKCGRILMISLFPSPETQDIQIHEEGTPAHESVVTCIETNAEADTVVTGGADGEVKLWHVSFEPPLKRRHSKSRFHYMKSIVTGRGSISNVKIEAMDFKVLNLLEFEPSKAITSFTNHSDIEPQEALVTLKRPVVPLSYTDLSERMYDSATILKALPRQDEAPTINNPTNVNEDHPHVANGIEEDSQKMQRLKRINKKLYLYCLNNLSRYADE